jgi:hypothetical protein
VHGLYADAFVPETHPTTGSTQAMWNAPWTNARSLDDGSAAANNRRRAPPAPGVASPLTG